MPTARLKIPVKRERARVRVGCPQAVWWRRERRRERRTEKEMLKAEMLKAET